MKKKFTYLPLIALFLLATGFVVLRYTQKEKKKAQVVFEFKKRGNPDANNEEWLRMYKQVEAHQDKLRLSPGDVKSMLAIANTFIQEARISGNYAYYDAAAMKYVNDVLEKDPANFEASVLKGYLYLSQHHFSEGLDMAEKARRLNPYNAFVYGVLVDGHVEMGNYDSAVANADRMVSIRPDIRSYSRVAYLREIYGDYPGAIEAMQMAINAGAPGEESTAWARIQLGRLYENTGDTTKAENEYRLAIIERPGYAFGLAGLGRLAAHNSRYTEATDYFLQALKQTDDNSFKEELAEVYGLSKNEKKSREVKSEIIKSLANHAKLGEEDEDIGHYADRELAFAYVSTGEYEKALGHAWKEYNRRPENIDVNETVGWVLYKKGDYVKAHTHMINALKTGSKNPTLICRAGLVHIKSGDIKKGKELINQGLTGNPVISTSLKQECLSVLAN